MSEELDAELLITRKAQLRRVFKDRRGGLDDLQRQTCHESIARHLEALIAKVDVAGIAFYFATPHEVDLAGWMTRAWSAGKRLYAPVLTEVAGAMHFYAITPDTPIQQGRFNLRTPVLAANAVPAALQALDAVLLPLVSFDGVGGRLGMGGGFYDRYFADAGTRPRMVGVAYDVQECPELLPTQPWDIPLDGVVTESGYRNFDPAPSQQH
jgi:5-formyltetrahydrofolate cyclo-ligase